MKKYLIGLVLMVSPLVYGFEGYDSYMPTYEENTNNVYGRGTGIAEERDFSVEDMDMDSLADMAMLRYKYENEVKDLEKKGLELLARGVTEEDVARGLHTERRELGVKYKDATPEFLRERIYARNLEKYGDEIGPSVEYLRQQGKSWKQIIKGAAKPGGGDVWWLRPVYYIGWALSYFHDDGENKGELEGWMEGAGGKMEGIMEKVLEGIKDSVLSGSEY